MSLMIVSEQQKAFKLEIDITRRNAIYWKGEDERSDTWRMTTVMAHMRVSSPKQD